MVRLAHSYPDGAPLVAITGQVGTDRLHIPVVNTMMAKGIIPMDDKYSLWIIGIPQKDYVNQLFDRADPYSVLFYLLFVVFIFNKYYFCCYSAINFPKSSPEHYTVTPSSSGRSGWSAGRSPWCKH